MSNQSILHNLIKNLFPRCSPNKRQRWTVLFFAIFSFNLITLPLFSQYLEEDDSTPQEVYLNFSYPLGMVNTHITALYVEPALYLPIGEIFRLLKINYQFNSSLDSVWGFYITESRKYFINFSRRYAQVGTTKYYIINSDEFIRSTFDIYIVPSVFERLFGLRFDIDFGRLVISLETSEELPIVSEKNRQRQQKMLESSFVTQADYPLLYPRSKNLVDGGFLDYSVTAASTKKYNSYGYDLRGGGIIAGGDLELYLNGNYNTRMVSSFAMEGRWRYVIDDNPYISNINAGYLHTSGIFPRSFRGIHTSNEPVQARTLFQTYVIEQKTFPQWTVELYLNEKLIAVTKADDLGNYRFVIPLTYGTTNYSLRIYGPTGEIMEDRQRIQIPFSVVPAGEINYNISGGTLRENNNRFVQAYVTAGLNSWLTSKAGLEFIDDTLYRKPIGSISLSSWLEKNYIITIDAAPGALYRSDFTAVYASQVSASLSITKHEKNKYYNPSQILTTTQAMLFIPFIFVSAPVIYRFQANQQKYENGTTTFFTTGTTVSYKQINGILEYRLSEMKYGNVYSEPVISSAIQYLFTPHKKLAHLTSNILFGAAFLYNLEKKRADELRLNLSSNVTLSGRIQFSYSRNFVQKQYTASMQFIFELPVTRSTTTVSSFARDASFIQNVRGTVGYDSWQKNFHPKNLESVGLSALTMRMFVDKNGDGAFNADEQTIDGVVFNVGQTAMIDFSESGITRVRRLLPYTRYNIDIIESSIENPLWIPKAYTFSTITEPNIYKPIDVPFYVSGVIEGAVFMQTEDALEAVPGVELHVKSIDNKYRKNIRVFADGSFYQVGIPPGRYIIYVDSTQLNLLGVTCEPPLHSFDVRITTDGDYIEELKFLLKKRAEEKTISVSKDKIIDQNIITIAIPEEKYKIISDEKKKGFVIHISTWDTERQARSEAKKLASDLEVKTLVEKIDVDGKTKYAVRVGVFKTKAEAFEAIRKLSSNR